MYLSNPDIEQIIALLESRPATADVANPYRLPYRSHNLRTYLHAMLARPGRRILLVGEALGYRGGLLTGIPVSSGALLTRAPHPFLRLLRDRVEGCGAAGEASATIVWGYLQRRRTLPLFWNAFPFHPHRVGVQASNRAPTAAEIEEGQPYLQRVAALFRPERIAGLGKSGTDAAARALPQHTVRRIRHPSHGGKADFFRGMDALLAH
jgi:uracil-DNA glycosylase